MIAGAALPTRTGAAWFWLRAARHVVLRALRDGADRTLRRHPALPPAAAGEPLLAVERSPLWTGVDEGEFVLVAGKVHNLRRAVVAFDGVVVGEGDVLSFWKQLGRPTRRRGFVEGREVREGCVVPTVAGGLCQLSNALVRCAVAAELEVIERWGHTARPAGEGGTGGEALDATVFWNYLDLRIRASRSFRIEAALDAGELRVAFRSVAAAASRAPPTAPAARPARAGRLRVRAAPEAPPARGCLTCDETACFRHRPRAPAAGGRTALLLDGWTPELARWVAGQGVADWHLPWRRPGRRAAGHWRAPAACHAEVAWLASLRRTLSLRRAAGEGARRQAAVRAGQALLACSYARRLRPEHTHLVVDQQLLLPLHDAGVLGGRSYDVLATALPIGELQARLDAASRRRPDAASLVDFRLDADAARREWTALTRAHRIVTSHADVASHLLASGIDSNAVELLAWDLPASPVRPRARRAGSAPRIAFPASGLARKGVHELAAALRELRWPVLVLGTPASDAAVWSGVDVAHGRYADDWPTQVDLVALPAYVEHSPRPLLRALAHGLPVVATPACGLGSRAGVFETRPGDVPALIAALRLAAASLRDAAATERAAA